MTPEGETTVTEHKADLIAMLKHRLLAFKRHKVHEVKTVDSLDVIVTRATEIKELAAKLRAIIEERRE